MPTYRYDGSRLREARESTGKSRIELGADVHRSESAITLYELGYRRPPVELLIELADELGVPVESFFVTEAPS